MPAKIGTIYSCTKCGEEVIVIKEGGNPDTYCCGVKMTVKYSP